MKTKSGAKKRFKITKSGLVKATQANKQHNMRNKSKKTLRKFRGTVILCQQENRRALAYFPYQNKKKKRKNYIIVDDSYLSSIDNPLQDQSISC